MSKIKNNYYLLDYYENYDKITPITVLVLMVFSLGLYFVFWIYSRNKEFEKYDFDDSPDSKRGLILMTLVPFIWFLITVFLNNFFYRFPIFIFFISFIGWFLIIFMLLQYLFEFCMCLGRFTSTNGFIWYMYIWVGFIPLLMISLDSYLLISMMVFPVFSLVFMQVKLNSACDKFLIKRNSLTHFEHKSAK